MHFLPREQGIDNILIFNENVNALHQYWITES